MGQIQAHAGNREYTQLAAEQIFFTTDKRKTNEATLTASGETVDDSIGNQQSQHISVSTVVLSDGVFSREAAVVHKC